jgi:hypothetical protein
MSKIKIWGMNRHDGAILACLLFIPFVLCCLYSGFTICTLELVVTYTLLWILVFSSFWFRLEISDHNLTLIKFIGPLAYQYNTLDFDKLKVCFSPVSKIEFEGRVNFSVEYYHDGQGYYWFDYPASFILFIKARGIVISMSEKHFKKLVKQLEVRGNLNIK